MTAQGDPETAAEVLSAVMDDLRNERTADLPTVRIEVQRALDFLRPAAPSPRRSPDLPSREEAERAVDDLLRTCMVPPGCLTPDEMAARASLLKLIPTKENDK